ncbi:hypothetical protein NPIL_183091 [Nephila pilipes]|uniref:Uncharacterized protein n=1 Tax=Nephila pilipes TaxID=299642 RepID=A0A8X6Q2C8_NEPPI|nr:hypothetical protein NPIL_183091 [Nephila pilipes]
MGRERTDGKALKALQLEKHGTGEGPIGFLRRERGTIGHVGDQNNDKQGETRMGRRKQFLSRPHRPMIRETQAMKKMKYLPKEERHTGGRKAGGPPEGNETEFFFKFIFNFLVFLDWL